LDHDQEMRIFYVFSSEKSKTTAVGNQPKMWSTIT